jgi:hypothetical protein
LIAVAVTACLAAGAAAAAAGGPLLGGDRPTPSTDAPVITVSAPADEPAVTVPPVTEPASTEPTTIAVATTAAPTTSAPAATEPPVGAPVTEPKHAAPPPTAPPVTDAPVPESPASEPPSTSRPDTVVPEGIHLECVATGADVTCQWSGGVVDGFAKFLLLRGDGGAKGRVPFMSADPSSAGYIDHGVPPGSYSYVLVTVDVNSHALVHSNAVFITIGAAG